VVSADGAARGLDIPSIITIVQYDVARIVGTFIHRVLGEQRVRGLNIPNITTIVQNYVARIVGTFIHRVLGEQREGWEDVQWPLVCLLSHQLKTSSRKL